MVKHLEDYMERIKEIPHPKAKHLVFTYAPIISAPVFFTKELMIDYALVLAGIHTIKALYNYVKKD